MLGFKKKASSKVKWKRAEFNKLCLIFIVIENVGSTERGRKTRCYQRAVFARSSNKRGCGRINPINEQWERTNDENKPDLWKARVRVITWRRYFGSLWIPVLDI